MGNYLLLKPNTDSVQSLPIVPRFDPIVPNCLPVGLFYQFPLEVIVGFCCWIFKAAPLSTGPSLPSHRQVSHFTAGALKPHFLPSFLPGRFPLNYSPPQSSSSSNITLLLESSNFCHIFSSALSFWSTQLYPGAIVQLFFGQLSHRYSIPLLFIKNTSLERERAWI